MKHIFLPVIIFFSIGLLTSCGGSNKQTSETEQSRYGINYSDTSTIKKDHKNVLVISSSPRREGNTDLLAMNLSVEQKKLEHVLKRFSWETMI